MSALTADLPHGQERLLFLEKFYNFYRMTDRAPPTFPSTALSQDTGTVLAEAARAPVVLTRYRKPRFALMTYEEYERLRAGATVREDETQRAVRLDELPPDELDAFVAAINEDLATPT